MFGDKMDWIFLLGLIISMVIGFVIAWFGFSKPDELRDKLMRHLIDNYLDERYFTVKKIATELKWTEDTVKKYLKELETKKIVAFIPERKVYALMDPLVFLTSRDYSRALRITKDDNILYGAYQAPYRTNPIYIGIQVALIAIPSIMLGLQLLGIYNFTPFFAPVLNEVSIEAFLLFLIAMGIIAADAFNNLFKGYMRERFSVVVGAKSGISYDVSYADEFSGRIRRGDIKYVDVDLSLWQKIHNYFGEIPIGDVKIVYTRRIGEESEEAEEVHIGREEDKEVKCKGRTCERVFRSMPFPRELFYVIRSIMLGNLGWRKRHADVISKWKSGSVPVVSLRRRR